MTRRQSDTVFHPFRRARSACWYIWWTEPDGSRRQRTTRYPLSDYTRDQVSRLIEAADPEGDRSAGLTIADLKTRITARLDLEGRSSKTIDQFEDSLAYLEAVYGPQYQVSALTRESVWHVKEYGLRKKRSARTINTRLAYIRAALNDLTSAGLLSANPFDGFERIRQPVRERAHLSRDETVLFLDALNTWGHLAGRCILRIITFTGIRRSEALSIERADVDLPNARFRCLNIKRRDKRKRWLAIPDPVRFHFEWMLKYRPGPDPFAVCHPDTLSHWAKELMTGIGRPDLDLKALRHTFATLALESGTPIRELQRHYDHSDTSVTELYSHDLARDKAIDIGLE